jgi:transposase
MKKNMSKVSNESAEFGSRRVFSEALKRKIVQEIGTKLHSVSEIERLYGVSRTSVYRWVYKYTPGLVPGVKQVVEMESEAESTRRAWERVAEMERALGRKQMELEALGKVVELASASLGFDLKKTFGMTPSNGTGSTAGQPGAR